MKDFLDRYSPSIISAIVGTSLGWILKQMPGKWGVVRIMAIIFWVGLASWSVYITMKKRVSKIENGQKIHRFSFKARSISWILISVTAILIAFWLWDSPFARQASMSKQEWVKELIKQVRFEDGYDLRILVSDFKVSSDIRKTVGENCADNIHNDLNDALSQYDDFNALAKRIPSEIVEYYLHGYFIDDKNQSKKIGDSLRADLLIWGYVSSSRGDSIQVELKGTIVNPQRALRPYYELGERGIDIPMIGDLDFRFWMVQKPMTLILFIAGYGSYAKGNYQSAIERWEEILRMNRNVDVVIYEHLVSAYLRMGHMSKAKHYCYEALRVDKTSRIVHALLGTIFLDRYSQHCDSAFTEFNLALEKKEAVDSVSDARIYNNLGVYYEQCRGDGKAAERYYLTAIELDPKFAGAHGNLGRLYSLWGDELKGGGDTLEAAKLYRKAIAEYQNGIRLGPEWEMYSNLGNTYREIGALDSAFSTFHRGLEISPSDIIKYNVLALYSILRKEDYQELFDQEFLRLLDNSDIPLNLLENMKIDQDFERWWTDVRFRKFLQRKGIKF